MLSNSIFKDIVEYIKVIDFRFVKCSSVHIFIETYLVCKVFISAYVHWNMSILNTKGTKSFVYNDKVSKKRYGCKWTWETIQLIHLDKGTLQYYSQMNDNDEWKYVLDSQFILVMEIRLILMINPIKIFVVKINQIMLR